jgi:hypothetical protein
VTLAAKVPAVLVASLLALASCGGTAVPPSPSIAQTATAGISASTMPTSASTMATPTRNRLVVSSLNLDLQFIEVTCDASASLVPVGSNVAYANCGPHGFVRFIGNDAGPLHPLRTAADGTELQWWDASGHGFTAKLGPIHGQQSDIDPAGVPRNQDGTWPGHGVAGHPAYVVIRTATLQYERQGQVSPG